MTRPPKILVIVVFLASLASLAQASTIAMCSTGGNVSNASGSSTATCSPADQSEGFPFNPGTWTRSESAAARAGYGILGVETSGQITSPNPLGGGVATGASASASFTDTFTVTTSQVSSGFIDFTDEVDGNSSVTGSGTFAGALGSNPNNPYYSSFDETYIYVNSVLNPSNSLGADYFIFLTNGTTLATISIPFITSEGGSFTVTLNTVDSCGIGGGSSCTVINNYFDTSTITGYSLTDSSGNPINGTVGFGSGTNYDAIPSDTPSAVTPEPSSLALLGTGIFGLAVAVRDELGLGSK
jgi:hypothetical protein